MILYLIFRHLNFFFYTFFINLVIIFITAFLAFFYWSFWNFTLTVGNLFMIISFFYCMYWFISIFFFLIKKSYLGKFSSVLQRFWKRSFMLFWSIEIFLFLIYLFLICNNPEETFYMLDFNKLNKILLINLNELIYKTLYLFYINIVFYFYILFLKVSKKKTILLLVYLISYIIIYWVYSISLFYDLFL